MRWTAPALGAWDRQKTVPLSGSAQARSKRTCSSSWMARSAACAAARAAGVSPVIPVCTSMKSGMVKLLLFVPVISGYLDELVLRRSVTAAEDANPADPLAVSDVVGLLLKDVVPTVAAHRQAIADPLPVGHLARGHGADLEYDIIRPQPVREHHLVDCLRRGRGHPVSARSQCLEVDLIGQQGNEPVPILCSQGVGERLTYRGLV